MEKRFIVARSKNVTMLSEDDLHDLLSLDTISNMVIIDRENMKNTSLAMYSDIVIKCANNPLALMFVIEMLKQYFNDKNYKSIDALLIGLMK